MVRPGLRGGLVSKAASPRMGRTRLSSSGSVQHQISLWNFIERAQETGTISLASRAQATQPPQPLQQETQHDPGEVEPLVEQIGNVQLRERTENMEVQIVVDQQHAHQAVQEGLKMKE